jgi:hypothetical protein
VVEIIPHLVPEFGDRRRVVFGGNIPEFLQQDAEKVRFRRNFFKTFNVTPKFPRNFRGRQAAL